LSGFRSRPALVHMVNPSVGLINNFTGQAFRDLVLSKQRQPETERPFPAGLLQIHPAFRIFAVAYRAKASVGP
jgi:hypothetical protein